MSELGSANPGIKFELFLAKDLEDVFFSLKKDQILALGFDIDSRNTLNVCKDTLKQIMIHLDRGNGSFVLESLQSFKDIISEQNNDNLLLEWELMECRALEQLESVEDAKEKYENLCILHPKDPRPFLYLAEIYLNNDDFERNNELLIVAEKIDKSAPLLKLEKLLRDLRLRKDIDWLSVDEDNLLIDSRMRANFYRLHAAYLLIRKDLVGAESMIERAIKHNPERISNYIVKINILEERIFLNSSDPDDMKKNSEKLLCEIELILTMANRWGGLSLRNQVIIDMTRFRIFMLQENPSEVERVANELFIFMMNCFFDVTIDQALSDFLMSIYLPEHDFNILLDYLRRADKPISGELTKALIIQFIKMKTLFSDGSIFFKDKGEEGILNFLCHLKNENHDEAWNFMKEDTRFALAMANCAREFPELRRKIIEQLPEDDNIQKDKLLLLLNSDESNIDEAFRILQKLDLSKLKYIECRIFLKVAREKKAWEFLIIVLEKLLGYEKDPHNRLKLKLELLQANFELKRLPIVIQIPFVPM